MDGEYINSHFDEFYNSQQFWGEESAYNEEKRVESFRTYLDDLGYSDEDEQAEIIDYFGEQLGILDGLSREYRFPKLEEIQDLMGE